MYISCHRMEISHWWGGLLDLIWSLVFSCHSSLLLKQSCHTGRVGKCKHPLCFDLGRGKSPKHVKLQVSGGSLPPAKKPRLCSNAWKACGQGKNDAPSPLCAWSWFLPFYLKEFCKDIVTWGFYTFSVASQTHGRTGQGPGSAWWGHLIGTCQDLSISQRWDGWGLPAPYPYTLAGVRIN